MRERLMTESFRIPSANSLRERYQALLLSDWNQSAFDATLALLWDELGKPSGKTTSTLREVLNPGRGKISGSEINLLIVERIRDFRSYFPEDAFPDVPTAFSPGKSVRISQAETT